MLHWLAVLLLHWLTILLLHWLAVLLRLLRLAVLLLHWLSVLLRLLGLVVLLWSRLSVLLRLLRLISVCCLRSVEDHLLMAVRTLALYLRAGLGCYPEVLSTVRTSYTKFNVLHKVFNLLVNNWLIHLPRRGLW